MKPFEDALKPELRELFRARRLQALETEAGLQVRILERARQELKRRHRLGELQGPLACTGHCPEKWI